MFMGKKLILKNVAILNLILAYKSNIRVDVKPNALFVDIDLNNHEIP